MNDVDKALKELAQELGISQSQAQLYLAVSKGRGGDLQVNGRPVETQPWMPRTSRDPNT